MSGDLPGSDRSRPPIESPSAPPSPDYSWMRVWGMSGVDHIRALTRQYGYRCFPSRSSVEIHLPGER